MRIKYKINIEVSSKPDIVTKDLGNITAEIVSDLLKSSKTTYISIPAGVTNYEINLDSQDIKFLYMESDGEISLKINSITNTPITIVPLDDNKTAHFLISTNNVSMIYLTNPSPTVSVGVTLVYAGK